MAPAVSYTKRKKTLSHTATRDLLKSGYLFNATVLYTIQKINNTANVFANNDNKENTVINIKLFAKVNITKNCGRAT